MTIALMTLNQASVITARKITAQLPDAKIYGLANRTQAPDIAYTDFGETVRELFQAGVPIIGFCAAGILIRTLAPLLSNKWQEPPVLAVAEDGSAVVPLLGGLKGANQLARHIANILDVNAAITTTGDIRFQTALLAPPPSYHLVNPEDAKEFLADLLSGASIKLLGNAPWLTDSKISFLAADQASDLVIEIANLETPLSELKPSSKQLIYRYHPETAASQPGKLVIVGTGPGDLAWMSPEVKTALLAATDWVGYKTYLNLVESLRLPQITRHESDNRVELDRAELALDLAAMGKSVAVVSSGDPGIFAMAAAVFEVLEQRAKPSWEQIQVTVCPGISAFQAAAALVGAPLGHDFCVISLSDILKPWEIIVQRIIHAAQADFVIAFYNPVSSQRTWQLETAKEILLSYRTPATPVILGRNLGRPGQTVIIQTLETLDINQVDMRTVVLVGSSQTKVMQHNSRQWVYTPRFYPGY
ncbi:precorrin-3B C(17)-methyltransferase [Synechococcus sp. PCC 6312]|uniref:precorrin-3B C(17)-methyltransferase n=1 Tax=Synechococcus sp. (strain ATCC 27167 / PCC 6312) TaxID=195253 RepID=UPI00029EEC4A|nr:precorrin-3B C(17)-methyltransferase [Synechococcus sp. PCC 6312]AFY60449.1 precorrin-3B C17-methyltransferase [Synechococcus sp. PCC 6312]